MTTATISNTIVVNGEMRSVAQGSTLLDIVRQLGLEPDRIAIEKDRAIVRRVEWGTIVVQAGSQLEIVQFVGGG